MKRNEPNDDTIRNGEPPNCSITESGGSRRPIMDGGEPPRQRPRPRWNIVSLLAPLAGLVLSFPFGLVMVSIEGKHPAGMGKPAASFFAGSALIGLLSGCIALRSSERLSGLSIVGLAVNAAILAFLVYLDPWSGPF